MTRRAQATFVVRRSGGGVVTEGPPAFALAPTGEPIDPPPAGPVERGWFWDGSRLVITHDRFGFHPLFYCASADGCAVSESLVELLPHAQSLALDDGALAVFVRRGFFLENDTPFREIRAVPPATTLEWTDGRLDRSSGSTDAPTPTVVPSRERAIVQFTELFQDAVDRMLPDEDQRLGLPLSGGRDSRHILLALIEAGRIPDECITLRHFPPKNDEDARVARILAETLGVPHRVLDQGGNRFRAERRKNPMTHFCADEHAWILPLVDYLAEGGFARIYDGIGGDVLAAGLHLSEEWLRGFDRDSLEPLARSILGGESYLPRMLTPEAYHRWSFERALARMVEVLETHRGAPNPVAQFLFWHRTRREIALSPWSLLGRSTGVGAPFLSHEVYDFLSALPAAYFLEGNFHTEAIRARYPLAAEIPFEEAGAGPVLGSRFGTQRFVASLLHRFGSGRDDLVDIRSSFVLPRLALGLLKQEYGVHLPETMTVPIYLQQLRETIRIAGHATPVGDQ